MFGRTLAAFTAIAALAACSPVVTSSGDYRSAGARSAGDASSQVAAASAVAELAVAGRAFQSYLAVVVADAEGALSGIESTFGDLQPPTPEDEATRAELMEVLGQAVDEVGQVRIAVVAGRVPTASEVEALGQTQEDLERLAGELA